MVLLLRKLIDNPKQRLVYIGIVIIAANAGGVWSPMGDVTTTMLWIGNQVTAKGVIFHLFLPSLTCLLVPLIICSTRMKGMVRRPVTVLVNVKNNYPKSHQYSILISGLLVLFLVPIFKTLTGLPPFMGILVGLGILWIITEIIHRNRDARQGLTVAGALQRIDSPSILFSCAFCSALQHWKQLVFCKVPPPG